MIEGIFGKQWKDWDKNGRVTFYKDNKEIDIPDNVLGDFIYSLCLEVFPVRKEYNGELDSK